MNPSEVKSSAIEQETFAQQKSGWIGGAISSPREKNLVIIAFVFGLLVLCLLSAIIMTIVIGVILPKQEYCLSDHCVKKAGSILRTMNTSANPCENFFKFACGGWVEEYDVDEDSETAIMGKLQMKIYRKFDKSIQEMKSLIDKAEASNASYPEKITEAGVKAIKTYTSCSNLYEEYKPKDVLPFMEHFGGWPMANKMWAPGDSLTLQDEMAAIISEFGVTPLFSIHVEPRPSEPTRNILIVSPPQRFPLSGKDNEDDKKYLKKIENICKEMGGNKDEFEADTDEMFKLAKEINTLLNDTSKSDEPKKVTVSQLSGVLDGAVGFEWDKLFSRLLGENIDKGNVDVIVRNKSAINAVLAAANKKIRDRALYNYFAISVLKSHPLLIVKDLEEGSTSMPKAMKRVLTNLKATCLETVSQYLNFAMDHLFVYQRLKSTDKAKDLISYIKMAFSNFIKRYDWLDDATTAKLLNKLNKMNSCIDYPPWLGFQNKVNEYYQEYVHNNTNPISAYVGMVKFGIRKELQTYKEITDRDMWPKSTALSISTVNAFYIPYQNNFVLPRAILNPPIYDEDNQMYLTFGSIGTVIGHEITHGFDSNGRNYDEIGKEAKIWTAQTTTKYNKLIDCFLKQYNSYVVDKASNTTVNGANTLAENIADNGGLRQAYEAYRLWRMDSRSSKELPLPGLGAYSPEQMFFISFGQTWCISAGKNYLKSQVKLDEHTPNNYRVIGTLSNMEEFAAAFKCPKSSPMNPEDKCVLW